MKFSLYRKLYNCFNSNFKKYFSTFKDVSYDKQNEKSLCNDTQYKCVFNFDYFVSEFFSNEHKKPASVDAILIFEGYLVFVEFKNQKPNKIDKKEVRKKIEDSIVVFKRKILKHCKISWRKLQKIYCVVFRENPSDYLYRRHIEMNQIKFGLELLKTQRKLNEIFTRDIKEMSKIFNKEKDNLYC